MKKWLTVGGLVLMVLLIGVCAWLRWKQDAPRRVSLAALQHFGAALDSVDSASLLNHLILPSAISGRTVPEQVEFITKALRDEISPEGIEVLRKRGQFGPLKDLFPTEADGWAKQAGVRVEDCVAFKMERNGLRCEVVLAHESGIQHPVSSIPHPVNHPVYRIVRCNNVKQMAGQMPDEELRMSDIQRTHRQ